MCSELLSIFFLPVHLIHMPNPSTITHLQSDELNCPGGATRGHLAPTAGEEAVGGLRVVVVGVDIEEGGERCQNQPRVFNPNRCPEAPLTSAEHRLPTRRIMSLIHHYNRELIGASIQQLGCACTYCTWPRRTSQQPQKFKL